MRGLVIPDTYYIGYSKLVKQKCLEFSKNNGISMEYVNRIKLIMSSLGLNQTKFAEKLGVSKGIISEFTSGARQPSKDFLFGISKLGISLDWFLTGEGEMITGNSASKAVPLVKEIENIIIEKTGGRFSALESRLSALESLIKPETPEPEAPADADGPIYIADPEPEYGGESDTLLYAADIAAGPPISQSEDQSQNIRIPRGYIKGNRADYYAAGIRGESMTGAGIPDGCTVLIRRSDTPRDGAIQVVAYQGRSTLKRMREMAGKGWELRYEDGTNRMIAVDSGEYLIQGDFVAVLPPGCQVE
jgi:SOS-response transcriptional repressor LexA